MLVVTRHRLPLAGYAEPADALAATRDLLAVLGGLPGFVRGWVARAVDDGDLMVLAHEWVDVGSYRRALSAYEVKLRWPLLMTAIDEPSAFEVLTLNDGVTSVDSPTGRAADADVVGQGQAFAKVDRGVFG